MIDLNKDIAKFIKQFEEVYFKCLELNETYKTNNIEIGIYYNTKLEYDNIKRYFETSSLLQLQIVDKHTEYRVENNVINIKILIANENSRGGRNHFVICSEDIDNNIYNRLIVPSMKGDIYYPKENRQIYLSNIGFNSNDIERKF